MEDNRTGAAKMQCAVCFHLIHPAEGGFIFAREIYRVRNPHPNTPMVVHLMCFHVRQLVPDTVSLEHCTRAALAPPDAAEIWKSSAKCFLCKRALVVAGKDESIVRLVGCTPAGTHDMHFGCYCRGYNARRKAVCTESECGGRAVAEARHHDAIVAWTHISQRSMFEKVRVPHELDFPVSDDMAVLSESAMEALGRTEDARVLIAAYKKGTNTTPCKQLCRELAERRHVAFASSGSSSSSSSSGSSGSSGGGVEGRQPPLEDDRNLPRSPLVFLCTRTRYTGAQMVELGLQFPMLFKTDKDWRYILDKKYFRPSVLMGEELNATFLRLLLAGMAMADFVAAGYTPEELRTLRFNVPAFLAAGGTRAQLYGLLGIKADLSEYPMARENFGLFDAGLNDIDNL